jgi:hypothetical protein
VVILSLDNNNQEAWKKLVKILQEVRIPNPNLLRNMIQESKLSFTEFTHFDLENYSSIDLLKRAEMIAQLLWFSEDTKKMQQELSKEFNIPLRYPEVEKTAKKFVEFLDTINAKTSASLERKFDLAKEYNIMQDFLRLTLTNPLKLKKNYLYFFEAVIYKYITPIARKLGGVKKKYLSPGEALQIIHSKTGGEYLEFFQPIDIVLRNTIAHTSFVYDETDDSYYYTVDGQKEPNKLPFQEFQRKIGELFVLYSSLMVEIDGYLILEAVRTILRFIINREHQNYTLPDHFWERSYSLTKTLQFDYLSHISGLHVTAILYLHNEFDQMKVFFQSVLQEHSDLRKNPDFIPHSLDLIFSLIRTDEGFAIDPSQRPAIKALFSVLYQFLHNLPNKTAIEMGFGVTFARIVANL